MGTELEKLKSIAETLAEMGGWDLSDLISQMKIAASGVELLTKAWKGNGKAFSTLSKEYPRLAKGLNEVKTSILNSKISGDRGNVFSNLNKGITAVRNNLTGLQKGATVAVAGIAEFSILSDTFKGLFDGSENVVGGIAKIGATAAAAGLAMYTALGPAGVAITAITALVAAFAGAKSAMDDMVDKRIGDSIRDALTVPGGVSLDELTDKFSAAMSAVGDSFSGISDKSKELDSVRSNIENTWLEIEHIKTSMDIGVISVEEGAEKLKIAFGTLAEEAGNKFDILEETLLTAFGEDGILSEVFGKLGIATEDTTTMIMELNAKAEERIGQLTELLSSPDISEDEYKQYKEELAGLMSTTDGLTSAMIDYEMALAGIDYSDLIMEDGSFDAEAMENYVGKIITAANEADDAVSDAFASIKATLLEEQNLAMQLGEEEIVEQIQVKIDALTLARQQVQDEIYQKATELTDKMQSDLLNSVSKTVENARISWNKMSLFEQARDMGHEGNYIKDVMNKQKENLDLLSDIVEIEMKKIGINNAGWADETMDEIMKKVFDVESQTWSSDSWVQLTDTYYVLKGNYKTIIQDVLSSTDEELQESYNEAGDSADEGIAVGMSRSKPVVESAAEDVAIGGIETVKETQDSHSPSRVYAKLGAYAVDGYNLGIIENMSSTIDVVRAYIQKVIEVFDGVELQYDISATPKAGYDTVLRNSITMPDYSYTSNGSGEVNFDIAETNNLLKELVSVTKEGHVIAYDGKELGRTIQSQDRVFYNRTGKGLFEH